MEACLSVPELFRHILSFISAEDEDLWKWRWSLRLVSQTWKQYMFESFGVPVDVFIDIQTRRPEVFVSIVHSRWWQLHVCDVSEIDELFQSIQGVFQNLSKHDTYGVFVDNPVCQDDLYRLAGFRRVDAPIKNVTDVSVLEDVHSLVLVGTNHSTTNAIHHVHPKNLRDITLHACLHSANIFSESYLDLATLKTVRLSFCPYLEDVSALGSADCVVLARCPKLANVAALASVRHVELYFCENVINVSCLHNVSHLTINGCHNIKDVSALGKIPFLDLGYCDGIDDVSSLTHNVFLDLSLCQNVRNVSSLGTVRHLTLSFCQNVEDVSALGHVWTLDLHSCPKIKDVSALGGVRWLVLRDCPLIEDISALEDVPFLDVRGCTGLQRRRNNCWFCRWWWCF